MKLFESYYKNVYFYFILTFFIIGSLLSGIIFYLYHNETDELLKVILTEEKFHIELHKEALKRSFNTVISDLAFLKEQNELNELIQDNSSNNKNRTAEEYINFADKKGIYDQIRYINENGKEIVRVNYNNGFPEQVDENNLQNKKDRYYFKDTISLPVNNYFVSPLDLNIENGKIEKPFKPMIRFATPVTDKEGNKKGIVILNYLAEKMINSLGLKTNMSPGEKMILNSGGYWMHCETEENEWGFMLEERSSKKFQLSYPAEWEKITSAENTQFQSKNGLFTAVTFYPESDFETPWLNINFSDDTKKTSNNYWKLVSHLSSSRLKSEINSIVYKFFYMGALLFIFSSFPAWIIAQALINGKLKKMKLFRSANHDKLTDLPNRTYLYDNLHKMISERKKTHSSFVIMFLDLDGFKEVNDTLGHDCGDQVLIQAAMRFRESVRESDFVSRSGGDEFIIVLPFLNDKLSADLIAEKVAEKIINSINKPFNVNNTQVKIGVSIGMSVYPDHGEKIKTLINNADSALYDVKRSGKNRYQMFTNDADSEK